MDDSFVPEWIKSLAKNAKESVPIRDFGTIQLPEYIESIINTPHHRENEHHSPIWLIWEIDRGATGLRYFPSLSCVCDSIKSARYHAQMVLDDKKELMVERVPCNHAFGSSIPHLQMNIHMDMWKKREELGQK